jgi:2'-5' RNA ligase
MRPNWFFAFPLDGSFIATLPPPPPTFRLFPSEDVHLTLSFLGACGEAAAERALAALDATLALRPAHSVEVSLGAVVPMGPKREYSALSALLEQGRDETSALIAELRDVLSDAALGRRDQRPPKPHVTLARPGRRATEAARAAGLEWAGRLDLRAIVARLDRIALYTWAEGNRRERLFRVVAERLIAGGASSH